MSYLYKFLYAVNTCRRIKTSISVQLVTVLSINSHNTYILAHLTHTYNHLHSHQNHTFPFYINFCTVWRADPSPRQNNTKGGGGGEQPRNRKNVKSAVMEIVLWKNRQHFQKCWQYLVQAQYSTLRTCMCCTLHSNMFINNTILLSRHSYRKILDRREKLLSYTPETHSSLFYPTASP